MATSLTLQNDASLAQGYVKVNGTTSATFTTAGISTPAATIGSITGMLKASSGVVSQAVAGTDYLTSTSGGTITLGTAQTASGTAVDFTGIPSWAKKITVMFNGVNISGNSQIQIQLGTSSGFVVTGYSSRGYSTLGNVSGNSTTGIPIEWNGGTASPRTGSMTIQNISSNTFIVNGANATVNESFNQGFGSITLSGTLDRVRITTISGSPTFSAGTINISFEG
jgi:hypothetical protein